MKKDSRVTTDISSSIVNEFNSESIAFIKLSGELFQCLTDKIERKKWDWTDFATDFIRLGVFPCQAFLWLFMEISGRKFGIAPFSDVKSWALNLTFLMTILGIWVVLYEKFVPRSRKSPFFAKWIGLVQVLIGASVTLLLLKVPC